MELIDQLRRDAGRDRAELRLAVGLERRQPPDVPALADIGIDEVVIVEAPPADADAIPGWVAGLARRWLPGERVVGRGHSAAPA